MEASRLKSKWPAREFRRPLVSHPTQCESRFSLACESLRSRPHRRECRIGPLIHCRIYCMITARFIRLWKLNLAKQGRAMRQVVDSNLAEREGFEPSVQV